MINTQIIQEVICDSCEKEIVGTKYFTVDTDIYFDAMIVVERGEYHYDCFLHSVLITLGKNWIDLTNFK